MNATTAPRRRKPEEKADTRQQADMRNQMHAAIDRIIDHYPNIAAEADNRGWPSNLRQDEPRRGGAELTSVEAAAEHQLFDRNPHTPDHGEWLAEYHELRSHVINVDARAQILDPPKAKRLGRENTVSVCDFCHDPIITPTQRKKGVGSQYDGDLNYHAGPAGQPWCYYQVRRIQ